MVRIHFVGGDYIDIHNTTYHELANQLNSNHNAKFINFVDTTVIIDNITYIERIQVDA